MASDLFVVVSYDIPDNKRRLKVAKTLLDYGGQRVQKSVFECYITARNLERLRQRLERCYDKSQDSIRFYYVCEACKPKGIFLGLAQPIDEPGLLIIG